MKRLTQRQRDTLREWFGALLTLTFLLLILGTFAPGCAQLAPQSPPQAKTAQDRVQIAKTQLTSGYEAIERLARSGRVSDGELSALFTKADEVKAALDVAQMLAGGTGGTGATLDDKLRDAENTLQRLKNMLESKGERI